MKKWHRSLAVRRPGGEWKRRERVPSHFHDGGGFDAGSNPAGANIQIGCSSTVESSTGQRWSTAVAKAVNQTRNGFDSRQPNSNTQTIKGKYAG